MSKWQIKDDATLQAMVVSGEVVKLQGGGKEYYAAAQIERERKISKKSNEQIEGQAVEFDEDQSKEVKKLWSKMTPEFAEGRRLPDPGVGSDMVPPSELSGKNSGRFPKQPGKYLVSRLLFASVAAVFPVQIDHTMGLWWHNAPPLFVHCPIPDAQAGVV